MSAQIELITGIAGTGKTDRLLDEYRRQLHLASREQRLPRQLWLTPTHRSRKFLLENLLPTGTSVCFSPNIFTFDQFAELVLLHSSQTNHHLSRTAKRIVLRNLIDLAHKRGDLVYFKAIAHTNGFLELVAGFISELKRDEIWPEKFLETCEKHRPENLKDRELGRLYLEYQNFLHHPAGSEVDLYDAEGLFWSARDCLERGEFGPFTDLELIVVDGFTDFTFTQYGILELLASQTRKLAVSLPLEQPLAREDLFAKTVAAEKGIKRLPGTKTVSGLSPANSSVNKPAGIHHLAEQLFENPRRLTTAQDAAGIRVVAALGPVAEIEFLAGDIKRKIKSGILPTEIAVVFRSLADHADLLSEVFTAAGIPFHCDYSRSVSQLPVTKALLSLLQLETEQWSYEKLMKLIDSNFFRPEQFCPNLESYVIAVGRAVRKWKMGEGRFGLIKKINWLAEPDNHRPEDDTIIQPASELLNWLSEITAPLRKRHSFADWIEQLVLLARTVGIPQSPSAQQSSEELSLEKQEQLHWEFLEKTLYDSLRFCQEYQVDQELISLTEFQNRLVNLLGQINYPLAGSESGRVRILEAAQIRNLDLDHLYIANLTEGSFPQGWSDDCIYTDAERLEFQKWDIPLGHSASRSQEEMLLFYNVVTRARVELCFSFPTVNSGGEPLFPSPYLQAIRELFDEEALIPEPVGDLDPVPSADRAMTPTDLRLVAMDLMQHKQPGLLATLFEKQNSGAAARSMLAATEMSLARFHTAGFTRFEGLVTSPKNLQAIQQHYKPDYEFSTHQLEGFATCPFRFLYGDVLKIQSLEPPEIKTDHRRRGIVTHEILKALHEQYQKLPPDELSEADSEQAWVVDRFHQLVLQKLVASPAASDLEQALTEIEIDLLKEWGDAFSEQWTRYEEELGSRWTRLPQPVHLELPFGDVPEEEQGEQYYDSVRFGTSPEESVPVRGRIDRVDVGEINDLPHYSVIDFKTGSVNKTNLQKLLSGKGLQLAIYTLVIKRLGIVGPEAVPFDLGYWLLNETGYVRGISFGRSKKDNPEILGQAILEKIERILDRLIPELVLEIRNGQFPVQNEEENCGTFCAYKTICRVAQIRALPDSLQKLLPIGIPDPDEEIKAED